MILCFRCRGKTADCEECGDYVRLVFSLVPVSLAVVSMSTVLLFQFTQKAPKQNGEFHFSLFLINPFILGEGRKSFTCYSKKHLSLHNFMTSTTIYISGNN